jgi:putative membrane protein
VAIFFLSCVIVAGTYGAITASKKIFFIQALPAIVALVVILVK